MGSKSNWIRKVWIIQLVHICLKSLRRFDKYAVARTEHEALVKGMMKIFFKFCGLLKKPKLYQNSYAPKFLPFFFLLPTTEVLDWSKVSWKGGRIVPLDGWRKSSTFQELFGWNEVLLFWLTNYLYSQKCKKNANFWIW